MNSTCKSLRLPQSGFSLAELMVGLAIGMLATVVIIQVMSVYDAQRRTTSGTADAQTNGAIALQTIFRDAQLAGYPLFPSTDSPLECTTLTKDTGATLIGSLGPISIADGVATSTVSASDSITIRYGTSAIGGGPSTVTATAGTVVTIGSNLGCTVNDIALVNIGPSCALTNITAMSAAGVSPITVTLGAATAGVAVANANVSCLGAWNEITYAVNPATGNLQRTVVLNGVSTTTPILPGIVNLQAQYGVSATSNSNTITQWVDAGLVGSTWNPPSNADRKRIKALRIAVVSRNEKMEMSAVTSACSSITTANPTGLCAWEGIVVSSVVYAAPSINLTPGDANWARYRYRVFETVIPLRNVIWAKDTL